MNQGGCGELSLNVLGPHLKQMGACLDCTLRWGVKQIPNHCLSMNSPSMKQIFRRLFSHETCSRIRYQHQLGLQRSRRLLRPSRHVSTAKNPDDDSSRESNWQQRTDLFPQDKSKDFERYPMVTADMLRSRKERPKRVKMLTRDFIEGKRPP